MSNEPKIESEILEPYIIIHSMNDVSFFLRIKEYLNTNNKKNKSYFNDMKLQSIFNLICKWYDKFLKFPTKKELKILNEKMNKSNQDYKELMDMTIRNLYDLDMTEVNAEYIENSTTDLIKSARVYEAMMLSQLDMETGNFGAVANRMTEAVSVNFDKDLGIFIKDVDKANELLNELNEGSVISSGIPSLDYALDGGFRGKEMYIFSAPPGVGKCCHKNVEITISYEIDEKTGKML